MKNKVIIKSLKKVKKAAEKLTGYRIIVTDKGVAKAKKKPSQVKQLINTELLDKKDIIIDRKRELSKSAIKKYEVDGKYRRMVNYTVYYENLDIRENVIFYESFHGKNMSCNPYAIFKKLVNDDRLKNYHHVWALNDLNNCPKKYLDLPNVEFVKVHSDDYLRYIASAKYLFNNTSFPPYFVKKDKQIYVNTWHGTPLKTLGKDMNGTLGQHKNLMRNFMQADYILAPNKFTADKIVDSHDLRGIYKGKIAETGYPRIDLTLEKNDVKDELNIPKNKKVLLYAPTWRGEVGDVSGEINKLIEDTKMIQEKYNSKYTILLKVHSLMQKYVKDHNLDINLVPDSIDTNELLSNVDVLITDYSSIFFDFMVTRKPIIFYAYDENKYQAERGFYLNLSDMPGPVCRDIHEVLNEINNVNNYKEVYREKLQSSIDEFLYLEDGNSTERVIDLIFNQDESTTYDVLDEKTNILIYCGGFLNNGVTTSAINLLNNIDYSKYNVIVADKANYDEESAHNFNKLNDNVKKYYRLGSMNVLLEEVDAQNYLFNYGAEQFYKRGPKNYLEPEIIQMYRREFKRMFGNTKIDVVIDFSGYVKFWTLLFATSDVKRKIIYQHNEMMEEYEKIVEGKFKHKENLNVIFPVYNYFDYIVSVAEHTRNKNRNELEHLVLNSDEKMVYVHNSINYKYVLDSTESNVETLTIGEKEYYVNNITNDADKVNISGIEVPNSSNFNFVSMGRLSPEKDHQKLIHAFYKLSLKYEDISLYIIGSGELKNELIKLINSLNLQDKIHMVGQLKNPFPIINKSDCFVLPSNHEGQPMVLLECLILGKPIVATDIPGNRSVLEDGYGEIVDNSIDGLIAGMEKVMNEKPQYRKFDYIKYNDNAMRMFYKYVEI